MIRPEAAMIILETVFPFRGTMQLWEHRRMMVPVASTRDQPAFINTMVATGYSCKDSLISPVQRMTCLDTVFTYPVTMLLSALPTLHQDTVMSVFIITTAAVGYGPRKYSMYRAGQDYLD